MQFDVDGLSHSPWGALQGLLQCSPGMVTAWGFGVHSRLAIFRRLGFTLSVSRGQSLLVCEIVCVASLCKIGVSIGVTWDSLGILSLPKTNLISRI